MKIVCSNRDESHRITFTLNIWLHLVVPALFMAVLMGVYVTTQIKDAADEFSVMTTQLKPYKDLNKVLKVNKSVQGLVSNDEKYKIDVNILARRLGVLEAESLRLNAFGTRIVKMAKLDPQEFAFEDAPPLGGIGATQTSTDSQNEDAGYGVAADDLMKSISNLETQLIDQRNRLEGMLQVLNGRILDKEVMPSGMPIEKGYISSKYGFRRDPFTGRKRLHKGIDFAGRKGTTVKAVAGGVVQFAGRKGGYGNVVELDHGDGLVSRYAHLSVINVKLDQVVKKGNPIALVGSTGRSTGPHLHLEVLKNGKQQNPAQYF
jgi:murein DD-endopeptidase MepM/ murein hydrolase activator NlpD